MNRATSVRNEQWHIDRSVEVACVRFERSNELRSVRNAQWRISRSTSESEERTDRTDLCLEIYSVH